MKSNVTSLYIHIPFCNSICSYCDFKKFIYNQDRVDKYFKSLFCDLEKLNKDQYKTIYIGGGTPSCVDNVNLAALLKKCKSLLSKNYEEFTIEANVEDINEIFLKTITDNGVNRLSVGIQSFNDKYIKLCNRHHNKEMVIERITLASTYLENISIDMIFAFPLQTKEDIKKELDEISKLPITHISYYSLLVEENTVLFSKGYHNMEDSLQADMYELIVNELHRMGFDRYEISNFAKEKKYESIHNKVYWNNEYYDAVGISACGYDGNVRYQNICNIIKYLNGERTRESEETIDFSEKMFEEIMLKLRLDEGLSIYDFNQKYSTNFETKYRDALEYNIQNETLKIENKIVKTTFKGSLLLNSVLEKFMEDPKDY